MPRFFIEFPYTNLNEVNLDWILDVLKTMQDEINDLDARVTALEEANVNP